MFTGEGKLALEQAIRKSNFRELFEVRKIAREKNKIVAKKIASTYDVGYFEIEPSTLPVKYFLDQAHLNADGQVFKAKFIQNRIAPYIEKITNIRIASPD